ncbi:MAG: hypothetical protein GY946_05405 [bacterium]|nr:hypothetical protein [bacterium]
MQANLDKTEGAGPLRHAALEREARSQLQMAVDTLGIDTHPVVDDLLQRGLPESIAKQLLAALEGRESAEAPGAFERLQQAALDRREQDSPEA